MEFASATPFPPGVDEMLGAPVRCRLRSDESGLNESSDPGDGGRGVCNAVS